MGVAAKRMSSTAATPEPLPLRTTRRDGSKVVISYSIGATRPPDPHAER